MDNWVENVPDGTRLRELERAYILAMLRKHGGNRTATVKALGICVRTLHRKMTEMREAGLDVPEPALPWWERRRAASAI